MYSDTLGCVCVMVKDLTLTIVKLSFLELPHHIYITNVIMWTEAP